MPEPRGLPPPHEARLRATMIVLVAVVAGAAVVSVILARTDLVAPVAAALGGLVVVATAIGLAAVFLRLRSHGGDLRAAAADARPGLGRRVAVALMATTGAAAVLWIRYDNPLPAILLVVPALAATVWVAANRRPRA